MKVMRTMMVVMAFALVGVGCTEMGDELGTVTYEQGLKEKPLCGGIAGFVCPSGMKCQMHETYPDAMGVCVGHADGPDCSAVRCAVPVCAEGHEPVLVGKGCCDYMCKRSKDQTPVEGQCSTVKDCDALPHIMCVGSWSCDTGWCSYTCSSEPISL